jgi:hypothetical protein
VVDRYRVVVIAGSNPRSLRTISLYGWDDRGKRRDHNRPGPSQSIPQHTRGRIHLPNNKNLPGKDGVLQKKIKKIKKNKVKELDGMIKHEDNKILRK